MPSDVRDIGGERFVMAVLDMAEAVDLRFSGSARHSETVGRYAEMTARELGLPEHRVSRIRLAGNPARHRQGGGAQQHPAQAGPAQRG